MMRFGVAMVALVGLGSCVTTDLAIPSDQYDRRTAAEMFSAGFEGIADYYVDAIPTDAIALGALSGITTLDPSVHYAHRGDRLIVTVNGRPIAEFVAPSADDVPRWAMLTSAAIDAGRTASKPIHDATPEQIYQVAFESALRKLDRFSRYLCTEEARSARASRNGYTGVGITIVEREGHVYVTSVFEYSPAAEAGVEAGDRIVAIEGEPAEGLTVAEVANRLRGLIGSHVLVAFDRSGEPVSANLERRPVIETTVHTRRLDNVGYIHISGFNRDTASSLETEFEALQRSAPSPLLGLILDLRQNRGGQLTQAVRVSDLFIDRGTILATQGRHPSSIQHFEAHDPNATNLPMVVLIDSGSASAAEIVAAALQDAGRALVIGARSYGKGTVQKIVDMPNRGELILTWARMHAPSGYRLSRFGVFPSICTAEGNTDLETVVQGLRDGRLQSGEAVHRRRAADSLDEASQEVLLAWCKGNHPPSDDDLDTRIAHRLLDDRDLFRQAFNASYIALSDRPEIKH
ncbi:C-terminal processing peptidase [alpha proteobacterium BAL199]|nr:C-terminal processing peptidase [alpha proteobacterium BAL199]